MVVLHTTDADSTSEQSTRFMTGKHTGKHEEEVQARRMFCKDYNKFCRAGGYYNWLAVGYDPQLHENYGLPCVGGTHTWEDGTETKIRGCIFCGGGNYVK